MLRVSMNKRDREYTDSDEWAVKGTKVYEIANDVISPFPYDLDDIFSNATEEEICEYLENVGFPWSSKWF